MKKPSFLLSLLVVALFSCQQVANENSHFASELNRAKEDATLPNGVIPKDIDLNEFINFSDRYTWKDLDDYYLNTLPAHFGKSYYNNLKKATIQHLVEVFDMPKYADRDKLEFYVNEMQSFEWFPPQPYIRAVSALKNHGWTEEQIKQLALERYQKNAAFISKTFESSDTGEKLTQLNEEMQRLKEFIEGFSNDKD
ncbi:MAG: hypothetical protein KatS3mg030_703 [Saprospiraceae bacterium]|nr:MAG: hypothetical protein KatS3mg030_703 [Saprospiraceae bacterium]